MLYRGLGDKYPFYRYYSYLNFLEYYDFLGALETMLTETPEEVTKRFKAVQSFFANNAGAVAGFAGNEKSIELNRALADAFMVKLSHEERQPVAYDLPVASQRRNSASPLQGTFRTISRSSSRLLCEENAFRSSRASSAFSFSRAVFSG